MRGAGVWHHELYRRGKGLRKVLRRIGAIKIVRDHQQQGTFIESSRRTYSRKGKFKQPVSIKTHPLNKPDNEEPASYLPMMSEDWSIVSCLK